MIFLNRFVFQAMMLLGAMSRGTFPNSLDINRESSTKEPRLLVSGDNYAIYELSDNYGIYETEDRMAWGRIYEKEKNFLPIIWLPKRSIEHVGNVSFCVSFQESGNPNCLLNIGIDGGLLLDFKNDSFTYKGRKRSLCCICLRFISQKQSQKHLDEYFCFNVSERGGIEVVVKCRGEELAKFFVDGERLTQSLLSYYELTVVAEDKPVGEASAVTSGMMCEVIFKEVKSSWGTYFWVTMRWILHLITCGWAYSTRPPAAPTDPLPARER